MRAVVDDGCQVRVTRQRHRVNVPCDHAARLRRHRLRQPPRGARARTEERDPFGARDEVRRQVRHLRVADRQMDEDLFLRAARERIEDRVRRRRDRIHEVEAHLREREEQLDVEVVGVASAKQELELGPLRASLNHQRPRAAGNAEHAACDVGIVAHEGVAHDPAERDAVVDELRRVGDGHSTDLTGVGHHRIACHLPANGAREHHRVDERLVQAIGHPAEVVEVRERIADRSAAVRLERIFRVREPDPVRSEDDVAEGVHEASGAGYVVARSEQAVAEEHEWEFLRRRDFGNQHRERRFVRALHGGFARCVEDEVGRLFLRIGVGQEVGHGERAADQAERVRVGILLHARDREADAVGAHLRERLVAHREQVAREVLVASGDEIPRDEQPRALHARGGERLQDVRHPRRLFLRAIVARWLSVGDGGELRRRGRRLPVDRPCGVRDRDPVAMARQKALDRPHHQRLSNAFGFRSECVDLRKMRYERVGGHVDDHRGR